jgi:predicted transcriptional regulator
MTGALVDRALSECYFYDMREHISITIETETAQRLRRYARRERRPVSQVVEMAIEELLEQRTPATETIVTTKGSFKGRFSREETYGGR